MADTLIVFCAEKLFGIEPLTSKQLWRYELSYEIAVLSTQDTETDFNSTTIPQEIQIAADSTTEWLII